MNSRECANAWKTVCKCYDETIDSNNPKIAIQKIITELGKDKTKEVFATIVRIKKHDERISGYHRRYMENVAVNEECLVRDSSNPVIYAGLDHIHTAHIDNLITELIKLVD